MERGLDNGLLDPENSLQLYSKNSPPGPNSSSFNNKFFDKIFDEISTLSEDKKKQKKLYEARGYSISRAALAYESL